MTNANVKCSTIVDKTYNNRKHYLMHRRSQDFLWGYTFSSEKLTTPLPPSKSPTPSKKVLKIDSTCSAWECTYNFSMQITALPPGGAGAPTAHPGYAYDSMTKKPSGTCTPCTPGGYAWTNAIFTKPEMVCYRQRLISLWLSLSLLLLSVAKTSQSNWQQRDGETGSTQPTSHQPLTLNPAHLYPWQPGVAGAHRWSPEAVYVSAHHDIINMLFK